MCELAIEVFAVTVHGFLARWFDLHPSLVPNATDLLTMVICPQRLLPAHVPVGRRSHDALVPTSTTAMLYDTMSTPILRVVITEKISTFVRWSTMLVRDLVMQNPKDSRPHSRDIED